MKILSPRTYLNYAAKIMKKGNDVKVDGVLTKEIIDAHFIVKNPLDRIVTSEQRQINFPFAVAEWLSLMTGEDRVDFYSTFIKGYDRYSYDDIHVAGAYGPRVVDQIPDIITELDRDPLSRRAVISIYEEHRDLVAGPIVPCTLTLQFLVRKGKLMMITNMRSNDFWLGVPYDIFQFTMLQEYIANVLGWPVGEYHHRAGSLHIYERNFVNIALAQKEMRWTRTMGKMPTSKSLLSDVLTLKVIYKNVNTLKNFEEAVETLSLDYFKDFAWAAKAFVERENIDKFEDAYEHINDMTVKRVMRNWMPLP